MDVSGLLRLTGGHAVWMVTLHGEHAACEQKYSGQQSQLENLDLGHLTEIDRGLVGPEDSIPLAWMRYRCAFFWAATTNATPSTQLSTWRLRVVGAASMVTKSAAP